MAIVVYDRDGRPWTYDSATRAVQNDLTGALVLANDAGDHLGCFNVAAWTHYSFKTA